MPFHWLIFLTCPFMGAPERSDSHYPFTKHKRYQVKQEYFPAFFGISWNCANAYMLQNCRNSSRNTTGFDYRHLSRASSRRVHAFPLQLHIAITYSIALLVPEPACASYEGSSSTLWCVCCAFSLPSHSEHMAKHSTSFKCTFYARLARC